MQQNLVVYAKFLKSSLVRVFVQAPYERSNDVGKFAPNVKYYQFIIE